LVDEDQLAGANREFKMKMGVGNKAAFFITELKKDV